MEMNLNSKIFIQQLLRYQDLEEAINHIYNNINNFLINGQFDIVDEIIESINIRQFELSILLSFLTITLPAKSILKNRNKFFDLIKQHIIQIGKENNLEGLLRGLK